MVVSDMDNGGSLIDVIDESELFEAEPSSSDFSWADDFISSSEDGLGVQGGSEVVNQTTHGSINTGQLAQPSLVIQQASQLVRTHEAQTGVQVIQTNHGMVQQQKPEVQNVVQPQQILSNLGNFQQGSGNQIIQGANGQLILKTASGQQILLQTQPTQQIQQIQQHGQTPSQQIQGGTPLASRSLTPSQSPVPISSPHIGHAVTTISRSMTPNQSSNSMTPVTMVTAAKSQGHVLNSMNAPNVNVLQLQGTSQSQQVLTRNIPLQGVIQMANPNTNNAINLQAQPTVIQNQGNQILQQAHGTVLQQNQGQATLVPGQGQNIVNTQNTVIQNPNVVNVNVAHVLCNNQLQNQQGGTVHHMANIQGTLIQTPDGKYIITQNPQLAQGQSVNFQNISQVALQQQQINVAGQTANQAAGSVGQVSGAIVQGSVTNTNSNLAVGNLGNVLRIAAQPSNQDKQNLATNATHFIGVNQQGQQVLIQRAPAPNNQQQNVILRTVNPANFLQIQQQSNSSTFGASSQAGQVAQQPLIMTSQQQQSAQLQKVIGQPGQQVKLFGPGGLQTAGPVTLNLAGQNINLQNLQGSNAVQTIQIVQQQQQQQQQLQQIQLQQQQIQKQVGSASGVVFSEFTNQENRTISPAPSSTQNTASMISSQSFSSLSQKSVTVSSSQVTQQLNQQNIFTLPNSTTRLNTSQIQQVRFATSPAGTIQQHVDNQVQGSPQQLAQSLQNIQLPLNQFSALNAPSLSTASPTVVTTTVSQTRVTSSNINVTNSPLMTQSVQPTSAVNMTPPKPPILQARINAPKLNQSVNPLDVQKLQQIQTEISKYSTIKNLTSEQKKHYMTLIEAHRRIVAQNPMLSSKKGQVVIQTTQASVVQAASKLLPDGQQQQVLVQSVNQQQTSVVDNKGLSTGGIQFNQHRTLQSQPGTGGLILAGNNLVNQSALFSTSTPVLTSTTSVTSSISSISSIPVPVQSFNSQTSPQPTAIQSNSVVTSHITATQSLSSNPVQTSQKTGLNQSIPVQNTTTVKVPVPTTVVQYNVPPGKVAIPASPQVAVPTQIKIGNHILSLNLTPQQKEKVQGYLSKLSPEEQQAQLATFLRLQAQQQLQNQIRAQVQNQQQQQTQKLLTTQNTATQLQQQQSKIPSTVQVQSIQQQAVSDKPVINTTQPLDNQQTVIIAAPGQKLTRLSVASIPKSQLIQQQLSKDQANALNPDVKSPFKTRRDTYRRLLRYHVYQSYERPDSAVQKNEEKFEEISAGLLKKKDWMFNRFHMLLLQESMREKPTSEMVMLQRLMNEDLKEKILEEKRLAKEEPEAFELMPLHLLEKQGSSVDSKQKVTKLIDKSNTSATEQIQRHIKMENLDRNINSEVEIKQEVLDEKPATPKLRLLIKNDGENFTSSITSDIDTEEGNHRNDVSDDESSKSQTDSSQNNNYSNVFCNTIVKQEPIDVEMNSEEDKWENNKPFQRYFSSDDSQMACDSDIFVSSSQQMIPTSESGLDCIPVNSSHRLINTSSSNSLSSNGAHDIKSPSHNSSVVSPSNNISNISDDSIHDDNDDISESIQAVKALNDSDDLEQNFYLDGYSTKSEPYLSGVMYESHPELVSNENRKSSFSNQNNITDISDSSQQSDNQNYEDHVVTSLSNNIIQAPVDNFNNIAQASLGQYEPISSPEAEHEESFSNFKVDSSYSVNIGDQKLGYSVPMETNIKLEPNYGQSPTHLSQKKDVHVDNISEEEEESDRESDPQNELMQSAINSILSLTQNTPPSHPTTSYSYDQSSRYSDSHPGYDSLSDDKMFGNELKTDDISEEEIPMEDDLDAAVNSILF